jgi:hypothetical protein
MVEALLFKQFLGRSSRCLSKWPVKAAVFAAGGTATVQGWEKMQRLDYDLLALNASPGGSADLLAATLFLDFMANSPRIEN